MTSVRKRIAWATVSGTAGAARFRIVRQPLHAVHAWTGRRSWLLEQALLVEEREWGARGEVQARWSEVYDLERLLR